MLFIAAVMFLGSHPGLSAKEGTRITVSSLVKYYHMGESVSLFITYENTGKETVSFKDPGKTRFAEVSVYSMVPGSNPPQKRFLFGLYLGKVIRIDYSPTLRSYELERGKTITLKPGEKYSFTHSIPWTYLLKYIPGIFAFTITDRKINDKETVSNFVTAPYIFTTRSVDLLAAYLKEGKTFVVGNRFAAKWLKKIYPQFRFFPNNLTDDKKKLNARSMRTFDAWWQKNKNSKEVKALIKKINLNAGIPGIPGK
ncbi:MAG: hypothetical protein GY754_12335 [bacterium]|nr:hypothetical protein [bacterium]